MYRKLKCNVAEESEKHLSEETICWQSPQDKCVCAAFCVSDNQANNSVRRPSERETKINKYLVGSLTHCPLACFLLFQQLAKMNLCAFISLLAFDKEPAQTMRKVGSRRWREPSDMKIVIFPHTYTYVNVCVWHT